MSQVFSSGFSFRVEEVGLKMVQGLGIGSFESWGLGSLGIRV